MMAKPLDGNKVQITARDWKTLNDGSIKIEDFTGTVKISWIVIKNKCFSK